MGASRFNSNKTWKGFITLYTLLHVAGTPLVTGSGLLISSSHQVCILNSTVNLICSGNIVWLRNSTQLKVAGDSHYNISTIGNTSVLTIVCTMEYNSSNYYCCDIDRNVKSEPYRLKIPGPVEIIDVSATVDCVLVKWGIPTDWQNDSSVVFCTNTSEEMPCSDTKHNFRSLCGYKESFSITITPRNSVGKGNPVKYNVTIPSIPSDASNRSFPSRTTETGIVISLSVMSLFINSLDFVCYCSKLLLNPRYGITISQHKIL